MSTSPYKIAQQQYAAIGVDTEAALARLDQIPVSMHCWQGDDVSGFESAEKAGAGNGCLATGNYPGKASNPEQLMADAENAGDYTTRLALMEDAHSLPWGAVWAEYCARHDTPADHQWLEGVKQYESTVLSKR